MALTIEQIRAARTLLPRRAVEIPSLDTSVFVRGLTLAEVGEIQKEQQRKDSTALAVNRKIIEIAACNEDGSALFVGEDAKLIDGLPFAIVDAIASAAMDLSGLNKDAEDAAQKN